MSTTPQEVPSVEETLNRTDFGHLVNENKKSILILGIVIVIAIVAYSVLSQVKNSNHQEDLDRLFKLEQQVFTPFLDDKDKKVEASTFITSLKTIKKDDYGNPNLTVPFLQSLNILDEKNALNEEVLSIASEWLKSTDPRSELYLFVGLRLSSVYEDQNNIDKSIALLEDLHGKKFEVLSDRVQFDLGRLYLSKGNKEKAKEHLSTVAALEGQSELKDIAKIYLNEL